MKTAIECFHGQTVEQLSKLPTRQLMAIRKYAYDRAGCGCCRPQTTDEAEDAYNTRQWELEENLKKVLSTREHIPSKREGQALRREAAKRGR